VLDDEPAASTFGQGLERAHPTIERGAGIPVHAADVDDDYGFGPRPERIEQQRVLLDV
jgi:hypothetical protein